MENGIEIRRARKELSNVPNKNGHAPYMSCTGSQTLPQRYFGPNALMEGRDCTTRVSKMPNTRTTITIPMITRVRLKMFSVRIWRKDRLTLFFAFTNSGVFIEGITRSG